MNISEFAVKHGAAVSVVVGLIIIFGVVSALGLPLQLLPNVATPQITIFNNWRSAAPQEVEEAIIAPQEEVLRFNQGVESIVAGTSRGQGQLTLSYQPGFDMSTALLDVINRLNQVTGLPPDAGEPFIANGSGDGLPGAASILLYANPGNPVTDMIAYQDLIEEIVQPRLARIPGIARVNLDARRPRQINVVVDPFAAASLGIQISDVAGALARARDVSGGFADVGRRRYTVRFMGEQEISELESLAVGWRNGQPVYLADVARVSVDYAENQGVSLRSGRPSYYISIARRNDANTVALLDELNAALKELNQGPLAAENITIELSFDASLHIRRALSMGQANLLLGIVLATLVLWIFLRSSRAVLIILMTVPLSLLAAFISLRLFGLTLNVISLAGLAFAVGLVMDASIIVQENITRLYQQGQPLRQAVINGCSQVSGALLSSTVTTVAIFIPILFMQGVEGQLFKDLAIAISVAVTVSMVAALTVLPVMTSTWRTLGDSQDRFAGLWTRLADLVMRLTDSAISRWLWVTGLVAGSVISAALMMPRVDLLPRANIDAIAVFFNIPAGMSVSTIRDELAPEIVHRLAPYLDGTREPGIRAYNFASFNGDSTQTYIYPADPDGVPELMRRLREEIFAGIPDVTPFVRQASMLQVDNGGGRSINVDIQGTDLPTIMAAATRGQEVIQQIWPEGSVFAQGGLSLSEPELHIIPDDRLMHTAGLDRTSLGSAIRAYTGGLYAGEYFDGNHRLDMIIRTEHWRSPEELMALPVATPGAGPQQIGDLVTLRREVGPTNLQRVGGRRTVTLSVVPPADVTLEEALEKLEAEATPAIAAMLPASATVQYRGNADRLRQALNEVALNFALALVILFMIMAALFRSIRDSLLVLLVMPVALAGGLAGLNLLNLVTFQSLDMLTMIGFIILLGLVVNNAILLVDQARQGERNGLSRRDAVAAAMQVRASVPMGQYNRIDRNRPLIITSGRHNFEAWLRAAIPSGNSDSQTFDVLIDVHGADAGTIIDGQFVQVALPVRDSASQIYVPRDAVVLRDDGSFVFQIDIDNVVRRIAVTLGQGKGDRIAVIGKLKPGDRVVTRGLETLKDGQAVKPIG